MSLWEQQQGSKRQQQRGHFDRLDRLIWAVVVATAVVVAATYLLPS
jgi:hypothetical protein